MLHPIRHISPLKTTIHVTRRIMPPEFRNPRLHIKVPQADARITSHLALLSCNFSNCMALLVQDHAGENTAMIHDDGRPLLPDDGPWLEEIVADIGHHPHMISIRNAVRGIPVSAIESVLYYLGVRRAGVILVDSSDTFDVLYRPADDRLFILAGDILTSYAAFTKS